MPFPPACPPLQPSLARNASFSSRRLHSNEKAAVFFARSEELSESRRPGPRWSWLQATGKILPISLIFFLTRLVIAFNCLVDGRQPTIYQMCKLWTWTTLRAASRNDNSIQHVPGATLHSAKCRSLFKPFLRCGSKSPMMARFRLPELLAPANGNSELMETRRQHHAVSIVSCKKHLAIPWWLRG